MFVCTLVLFDEKLYRASDGRDFAPAHLRISKEYEREISLFLYRLTATALMQTHPPQNHSPATAAV